MAEKKWHPIEFSGYWMIHDSPYYESNDVLNAEHVGEVQAEENAKLAASAPFLKSEVERLQKLVTSKANAFNTIKKQLEKLEKELNDIKNNKNNNHDLGKES